MRSILFVLWLVFYSGYIHGQKSISNDKEMEQIIKEGLDYTYNLKFEQARNKYEKVKEKYPLNPAYSSLIAMNKYWEMIYTNTNTEESAEYLKYLNQSIAQSEVMLKDDPKSAEAIFISLSTYSYLALYYSQRKETLKSI